MNSTLSPTILLTLTFSPLLASIIVGIFGTHLGNNLIGKRLGHTITVSGILLSFILSCIVLKQVLDGSRFNATIYEWMILGKLKMEVGFMVDGLTSIMICVVTFVSLMVHIYTIGYMKEDEGYNRFFSYLSLFTFAMLMLVMSNNFLQLFFGWEAVGLVSYLLIGFWHNKQSAIFANMKAFLVNRVGDFGFILGIGLIVSFTGSLNYIEVFEKTSELTSQNLPGTNWLLITVICICLFIGAMGKSAQFPLHVWLPDSMEGPTPISALIHAATMVTAGIFMVARMSPLYELSDTALSFIMIIGSITALFMGILGIIQYDIKRVIAYSTLSQLGYMTVALGASAYSAAVFHLMTHAFFKALLFLGAGSVIIGCHHNQDIRYMGGIRKYMPITWITSLIGSLALIGTPFLSGFYSKDSIIEAVHLSNVWGHQFANFSLLAGVFITAFYSFRMYFLVFHGSERYNKNPDNHSHNHHNQKPLESPWVITAPLILLAIPSILIGFFTIYPILFGSFLNDAVIVKSEIHPSMTELIKEFSSATEMALHAFKTLPFWLATGGVALSYYLYIINNELPGKIKSRVQFIYKILENKYYLDWFNENVIAYGIRTIGKTLWKQSDQKIIDGLLVNGTWKLIARIAHVARQLQSGYLYHYALIMIAGIFALMTYFVWMAK